MNGYCNIVIVDDEILVRQGIKHLLDWEKEGFHIIGEAANGKEAFELIGKCEPHIVITDIVMPIMDGVELTSLIKQHYPQTEVLVLSSFSEFNYVRDTFKFGVADYILKPKLDADYLLSILKRTVNKIPQFQHEALQISEHDMKLKNVLEKLLSGYSLEAGIDAGELFRYSSFQLLGADLKHLHSDANDREAIKSKIKDLFLPFADKLQYEFLPVEEQYFVILLNGDAQALQKVKPAIRALANSTRYKEKKIVWLLDSPFTKITELYEQYEQSFLRRISYRYFLPLDYTLIVNEELPKLHDKMFVFNMNEFIDLLSKRKFDQAVELISQYIAKTSKDYRIDSFAYKTQLGHIIFNSIIFLNKLNYDTKQLEAKKYLYMKNINESSHVNDAIITMNQFMSELNSVILSNQQLSSHPNLKLILEYIHEHYMEPISLGDVAQHFHFNSSYLSTLFSTHNDEGFSEYLNRYRVEKAAEYLAYSDLSISDIGVKVGYSDHSYFTKVFKKLKGISPSQYRKISLITAKAEDK